MNAPAFPRGKFLSVYLRHLSSQRYTPIELNIQSVVEYWTVVILQSIRVHELDPLGKQPDGADEKKLQQS